MMDELGDGHIERAAAVGALGVGAAAALPAAERSIAGP
jgi:hypothetical protein